MCVRCSRSTALVPFGRPTDTENRVMPQTKSPLDYANLNLDDAQDRHAFYDALLAKGTDRIAGQLLDFKARGIIDDQGNPIPTHIPADMLDPDSSVEQ